MATDSKAIHRITDPIDTIRATMTDPQLALSTTADATRNVNVGTMVHRLDDDFYTNVHNTKIDANTGVATLQTFKAADGVEDDDVATVGQLGFVGSGICANRPTVSTIGVMYFDTNKGFPTWWNGTTWVNATGAEVLCSITDVLGFLTFLDTSSNNIVDTGMSFLLTAAEAQLSYTEVGKLVSDVASVTVSPNCVGIENSAFRYWDPTNGLDLSNATLLTSIGSSAFQDWVSNDVALTIPDSVTSMSTNAFRGWEGNNQPLTIGSGVETLSSGLFSGWKLNNSQLTIPSNIGTIEGSAFINWQANDQPLTIPNTVTTIGAGAFGSWYANDQALVITTSIDSIPDNTFSDWTSNNKELIIPGSITSIGKGAFLRWESNNQPLTIPSLVTVISDSSFEGWSSNNQILSLPDSLVTIGYLAFENWSSNNQPLTIPLGVTSISANAFRSWRANTQPLDFKSVTPPALGSGAFGFWNALPSGIIVTVPGGADLSAWKVALTGSGTFYSINGVLWNSIP